ncbi:MAG: MATE family efflux transporter [Treponema sp.]|jgi:putative MATE family efflux protein|nr:MATE family efflux transporter [Treponema sp.]
MNSKQDAGRNIALMESAPVAKSIIKLALPMMLGMIAQLVYNITDTFFIGQTGDPNMVAGISLTMPLFIFTQGIGNVFGVGASSYISRLLGARKTEQAKQTNSVSFYTTICVGLVFTALIFLFKNPVLRLSGASDATFVYANEYFSIIGAFTVVSLINISLSGQIRSEGATNTAMYGMLIGIVLNVILDPVFILVLGWGAAGAAWATIIGGAASALFLVLHVLSEKSFLSISPRAFKPSTEVYAEILKIGLPSAISSMVMSFSAAFSNRIAASYGDFVIAGKGVTLRVESISFMLIMALAMGYQPFAGFNYGAKNFRRLTSGFRVTLLFSTALALFFSGVFALFGKPLIGLFISDSATIDAGWKFMRAFLIGLPVMGIQMTLMVTFQALGKPVLSTIVSLGRQCLFYLPLLFILNHIWQFEGFMYSQPLADILTALAAVLLGLKMFAGMKQGR